MSEKRESYVEVGHGHLAEASESRTKYPTRKQERKKNYSRDKRGQQQAFSDYSTGSQSPYRYHSRPRGYPGGGGQRSSEQRRSRGESWHKDGHMRDNEEPSLDPSPRREGSGDVKKKPTPVSLNHLLSFTIAPRERYSASAPPISSRKRRSRLTHSYNKEQFLQANCQFVVSATGDYSVHSGDPDRLVDWDRIEQVRLFCHQIPSCPICLYPPRAAKITRCGHVYCWSCVLHYLSLSERKWHKCPICYESIYRNDLKSVTALSSPQYKEGDVVTMKLMIRERGATQPVPKSHWAEGKQGLITLEETSNRFVKLLTATAAQVLRHIVEPERSELTEQLKSLTKDEASEQCFIESALEDMKAREKTLKQAEAVDSEVAAVVEAMEAELDNSASEKESTLPQSEASGSGEGGGKALWTAYADNYFKGDFETPFSESEGEEEEESLSAGTSESPAAEESDGSSPRGGSLLPLKGLGDEFGERAAAREKAISLEIPEEEITVSEDPLSESGGLSTPPKKGKRTESVSTEESSPEVATSQLSSPDHSPQSLSRGEYIYFYQASDGQHLYLHPINFKCLAKEYSGLENCPEEIKARIVEMEQLSMTEEVRSRYRYLSHLPLTCELVLCELDLKPPTLSRETVKAFSDELQRRRQKRIKKRREEKRREKKTEAKLPRIDTFPTLPSPYGMTPEKFHDLLSLASSPSLSVATTQRHHSGPTLTTPREQRTCKGDPHSSTSSAPSFAQALQGKPPPVWPIKTSPKTQGTAVTKQKPSQQSGRQDGSDEEYSVPSFHEAFNEALLSASVSALAQKDPSGKPGSKTAKKGRKKLVLFSTGGARGTS